MLDGGVRAFSLACRRPSKGVIEQRRRALWPCNGQHHFSWTLIEYKSQKRAALLLQGDQFLEVCFHTGIAAKAQAYRGFQAFTSYQRLTHQSADARNARPIRLAIQKA